MKTIINSDSQRTLCENKSTENIKQHSHNNNISNLKYQYKSNNNVKDNDVILMNNKINRVQQLVMKAFKNENNLTRLKNKLGNDLETKLINADVDEEYINKIEQALNEINDDTFSSQKFSKSIQIQ